MKIRKNLHLLKQEGLRWYLKIKKGQLIAFITRKIFSYNRLEITIFDEPNGDKSISIFDRDTMVDYEWIAPHILQINRINMYGLPVMCGLLFKPERQKLNNENHFQIPEQQHKPFHKIPL